MGWAPNYNFDGQEGLGDRNISKLRSIGLVGVHKWQGGKNKILEQKKYVGMLGIKESHVSLWKYWKLRTGNL